MLCSAAARTTHDTLHDDNGARREKIPLTDREMLMRKFTIVSGY